MRLRLGTFNVWGLPEPFARHVEQRIRKLAARLPDLDLDVLFFQEAWTPQVRQVLIDGGAKAGFHVSSRNPHAKCGGLLVLSRLPIRGRRFERYRFRGDPERVLDGEFLGAKGFLVVRVDGPDGPIALVNTHLLAHYRGQPRLENAVRTVQLLQLIDGLRDLDDPILIGGDFNCCHDDPEYRVFTGLTGAVEVAEHQTGLATISRSNYYKRRRSSGDHRIDFLFVRGGPEVTWKAGPSSLLFHDPVHVAGRDRSLSDHFGLASELELTTSAARQQILGGSLDRQALELAGNLVELGRAEVLARQQDQWRDAGSWLAGAALAVGSRRIPDIDRRVFLRGAAQGLTLLALAPAAGYTSLAGLDAPHKLDAFDRARTVLAELERHARPIGMSA